MKKIDIYEPYVLNFRCQKLRASILKKMAPNPCTCFVIGCHPPPPLLKLQPIEIKLLGAATLLEKICIANFVKIGDANFVELYKCKKIQNKDEKHLP